jgi:capsular exopolysaccharide synthesis family protein
MNSFPHDPKDLMRPAPPQPLGPRMEFSSFSNHSAYGRPIDVDTGGFVHYLRLVNRRKLTVASVALAGAVAAFLLTLPQTPVYRAETLLEVENLNQNFLNMQAASPTTTGTEAQPEYNIRTYTTVMKSRPVLERAVRNLKLQERGLLDAEATRSLAWRKAVGLPEPQPVPPREQALLDFDAALRVNAEPRSRVISVTFDAPEPQFAADFTNAIAQAFVDDRIDNRWKSSENTLEFLGRRLDEIKAKLRKSEDELQKLAAAANLTFLSERDNVAEEKLRQVQAELSRARAEAIAKQSAYELVASSSADSLPDVLNDATLKDYSVELTNLERDLAEQSTIYAPQSQKLQSLRARIDKVRAAYEKKRADIVARVRNEYTASQRREKLLQNDYWGQVGLMNKQSDKVAQYMLLKREVDTNRNLYDSMLQRVSEAGFASAMRESDVRVIEQARTPRIPYKPNYLLNTIFGLVSGLCFGIGFVVLRANSDRRIQEPGETTFHLNVPELGVIPSSGSVRRLLARFPASIGGGGGDDERLELTAMQQRPSALAESFRVTLASILCSEQNGARPRVIAFSSANPGEGKTTVISNLAISLAQVNKRVLLVDGDMRKPRLHEVFGLERSVGLSDLLSGRNVPIGQETRVPNLFLLPSGKGGPAGLNGLFTPQLRALLRRLKSEFEMVLIDTPPMLHMPDARLIGRQADAVILVVAQHTNRDVVRSACERLSADGSVLLGTILNNWNPKNSVSGYTEYKSYYKAYHDQA